MTTARTTTAQPIAASISIPDAILHSTAFARRKPLLLLKIVRQTGPRSVRLPQTARRRSGKRHRPPRKVRKARVGGLRPRLSVCDEKAARQKGRPDRAGVRRRGQETGCLAGSAQRSAKSLRLCGNGPAAPILSSSPAVPPPRSAAGEPPEACRPRPPSCTAVRILQGLAFSASPPNPAAPDISLRARLYFAECRVFRNAAQLPPSASPWPHTRFSSTLVRASPSPTLLRIAAQSLIAVLDVFSCARRGRPFPPCPTTPRRLRTPDSSALRLFSAARPFAPKLVITNY